MTLVISNVDQGSLEICLAIRHVVFIDGQNVPEHEEVDGLDPDCLHYLATIEGKAVATARALPQGDTAKIQRVAVLKEARSGGLGSKLMMFLIDDLSKKHGYKRLKLGAQLHAIPFYERLGFAVYGPEYDDAGIVHRDMKLELS